MVQPIMNLNITVTCRPIMQQCEGGACCGLGTGHSCVSNLSPFSFLLWLHSTLPITVQSTLALLSHIARRMSHVASPSRPLSFIFSSCLAPLSFIVPLFNHSCLASAKEGIIDVHFPHFVCTRRLKPYARYGFPRPYPYSIARSRVPRERGCGFILFSLSFLNRTHP